ncbi:MAG: hypothetical protein CVU65_10075 [Deltaproteobacteria bacterium HGW-Deltaproteobacteria-22]|jgi:hypothetical protein|nr:MAG: hypothetical protein CVU65_10075 [Deltaproteobacteria bacterium HGW-Deltaproteobacteria-22]
MKAPFRGSTIFVWLMVLSMTSCRQEPRAAQAGLVLPHPPAAQQAAGKPTTKDSVAPVPAPKVPDLPPQIADQPAAAALVWIAPPPDEDEYVSGDDGTRETPWSKKTFDRNLKQLGARTFWVVPGEGTWTLVAQRPGLFLAARDHLYEARSTYFKKKIHKPQKPVKDEDGNEDWECGWPMPEGIDLEIAGSGLVLRDLDTRRDHPVVSAPETFEKVETCTNEYNWWVEALGGLGRYLFLNHRNYQTVVSVHWKLDFLVFDLEKLAPVQAALLPAGTGGWRGTVDLPAWRPELDERFKKLIEENNAQLEVDPKEVHLSHLWPVFSPSAPVGLELAFRHEHDCWPCPAIEVRKSVDDLPQELLVWRKRHPAVDAVIPRLPEKWRIAGITVLTAAPEQAARLRALFEAVPGGK